MNDDRLKALFQEALDTPAERRAAFVERACAGQPDLRREIEALLRDHEAAGEFLAEPTGGGIALSTESVPETGTSLGPYRLLEPIGEGGFGVVYVAEQTEPVRRRVALKVIKAGMDTREVVARFEAERQALALMDHPHIARVFDGGSTPGGRPYFVMELVKGIPIHEYCDQCQLPLRERLGLFAQVCRAVQHAHQKGVIHRDLKPSNVLVAMQDGKPAPKVIDFGVAKATGPRLTEATFHTRFAQMIGTPAYMSPEQAEMSALDIDTRSDIYSLGVLLYELLTGTTPFTREQLQSATFDELRRLIREVDPPTPSARLTSLNGESRKVAAARRTDIRRLAKSVHGELDWIVMKALEKDRTRRYETANGLVADIERYLANEPVTAGPPSAWYRARKFARRHGIGMAVAATALAALLTIGWFAFDRSARRAATRNQIAQELERVAVACRAGRLDDARTGLQRAEALASSGEADATSAGRIARWRDDFALLRDLEEARLARSGSISHIAAPVAGKKTSRFRFDQTRSDEQYREAFRAHGLDVLLAETTARIEQSPIREQILLALSDWLFVAVPAEAPEVTRLWDLLDRLDHDPWRGRIRKVDDKEVLLRVVAEPGIAEHPTVALTYLAGALEMQGERDAAIRLLREVQLARPGDVFINYMLGALLHARDRDQAHWIEGLGDTPPDGEAAGFLRAALAARPDSPGILLTLSSALSLQGDHGEAASLCRRVVALQPDSPWGHYNLAQELLLLRDPDGAIRAFGRAAALRPDMAEIQFGIGMALWEKGDRDASIEALRRSIRLKPYAEVHNQLGVELAETAQLDAAVAEFKKAVDLRPEWAPAWVNLGRARAATGDAGGAVKAFQTAIHHDPGFTQAHVELGRLYHAAGMLGDAAKHYRQAVEHYRAALDGPALTPRHTVCCALGHVLRLTGKYEEAAAEYEKAVQLEPGNSEAHGALAWMLAARGAEPDRAVRHALEASRLAPDQAWLWTALGIARYRAGDYEGAAQALEKSMSLQDGGGDANEWFFMAMIHARRDEPEEARKWYDRAIAWLETHLPPDPDYRRFQAEAREVLGLGGK